MQEIIPLTDAFPFDSKFITIHQHKLQYIDVSKGNPTLFLHGNPTSSYVDIGPGFHFLPEDNPTLIGQELSKWYENL